MHLIDSRNPSFIASTLHVNGRVYTRQGVGDPFLIANKADALAVLAGGEFVERAHGIGGSTALEAFPWTEDYGAHVTHPRPSTGNYVGYAILNALTNTVNYWTGSQWIDPDGNPA